MKTRNGFVSNSSSSSFVIIGVNVSDIKLKDGKDMWDAAEEIGLEVVDDCKYMGAYIAKIDSDSYDIEEGSMSASELKNMIQDVENKVKEFYIKNNINKKIEVKLYKGVEAC